MTSPPRGRYAGVLYSNPLLPGTAAVEGEGNSLAVLQIILPTIIATASGFRIETPAQPQHFPRGIEFSGSTVKYPQERATDYRSQPIAGYPKAPPPNARESGGNEDDLLPPFEDSGSQFRNQYFRRSIENVKVDPKTGYPLVADQSWKFAGGDEESLELPLDDAAVQEAVDPKTGYPLFAQPHWKDAGGDGDVIELPLEDAEDNFGKKEAVDPKTGYPLSANPEWKNAGGDGEILELPLEDPAERSDEKAVDPKTGYPLVAEDGWKDAGGDGDILDLPIEPESAVDPKTGYPLVAQPSWKDAGGDEDILELPLDNTKEEPAVDPKTGYPLTAQPSWKHSGGDGDILQLPLEDPKVENAPVDPKTGYPLTAQPEWKHAGGDGDILQLPLQPQDAIDPKTGYPLTAQPGWKLAGGDEHILDLPLALLPQISSGQLQSRSGVDEYHVFEIVKLTELRPPPLEKNFPSVLGNSFSTPSPFGGKPNQKRSQTRFETNNRPVESTYTYTGPENVVVTVTRYLSDKPININQSGFSGRQNLQNSNPKPFQGVPAHFNQPFVQRSFHQNIDKRHHS